MIYADPPRKYSRNGRRWSHLSSPDLGELTAYAKTHGLKRRDRHPWIHYDVTDEELVALPDIKVIDRRQLLSMMKPYRQPRKS